MIITKSLPLFLNDLYNLLRDFSKQETCSKYCDLLNCGCSTLLVEKNMYELSQFLFTVKKIGIQKVVLLFAILRKKSEVYKYDGIF